ncbi:transient receptor potential cation channel subfamily M member-like 2 [Ylistrum balloti]|uniref:transient receptor potential cation channel subfamily M member-like 2 n=1 Tax=Ylistrum balloti TaxID=509963 RepID=UPI002905EC76|nr:transient receptor potential cation channel subfamily M member-like 2 [Ylistrum balloti]
MGTVHSSDKWHWDEKTGNIRFTDCDLIFQYAIIKKSQALNDDDKEAGVILKQLMEKWGLKTPSVLISVTGGAKSFELVTHKRTIFKRELIKLARTIDIWVVSGGSDCGIMKEVGEAVRDANYLKPNSVVAIGIATFGVVAYREDLGNNIQQDDVYLANQKTNENENETNLDPNHSHFILVDDGTEQQFGKEISFRAGIEMAVSKLRTTGAEAMVPVVLLVVEGGPNTIKTVKEAVCGGIPTVLVKGSGKAADVLALACECAEKPRAERMRWESELRKLTGVTEVHKAAVYECMEKRRLITVFDMTDTSNMSSEMGEAILTALRNVERENRSLSQLKLALYWNRIDTANDIMRNISRENLHAAFNDNEMITSALVLDRSEFMEIFLAKGMDMTSYLSKDMLTKLYCEIPNDGALRAIMWKVRKIPELEKDETCLVNIGKLITLLLGTFYDIHPLYAKKGTSTIDNPFQHLLLWCILSNRHEMAKLFWKYGKDQIAAALVAYGLLKKMALLIENKDLEISMNSHADEFCQLAQTLLSKCRESSEKKTSQMLSTQMDDWGNATCRQIARMTENKSFIAHPFFQSLLSEEWMGDISLLNRWTWFKLPLCVVPPMQVLIPCLITFKEDDTKFQKQNKTSPSTSTCNSDRICSCEKIIRFYQAPVVKFVGNSMIYVVFLMLFAYALLSKFDTTCTKFEVALAVCVSVLFCDEIIQMKSTGPGTYFQNKWNYLDISGVILFVCGFCIFLFESAIFTEGLGRMICSFSFICFSLSLLGVFALHENVGPQLQMIKRMFFDLLSFLAILLICVMTYAIAAYVNLYPASRIDGDLVFNLLRIPYWNLYGELNLEVLELKEPDCSFDPLIYQNGAIPRCPTAIGSYLVPVLMGMYMLFASILLLNLLIAMFSNSYAKVQAETHLHWCFQRSTLIHECSSRPRIPLPFKLTTNLFKLLCCCRRKGKLGYNKAPHSDPVVGKKCNSLTLWEKAVTNEFMNDLHSMT